MEDRGVGQEEVQRVEGVPVLRRDDVHVDRVISGIGFLILTAAVSVLARAGPLVSFEGAFVMFLTFILGLVLALLPVLPPMMPRNEARLAAWLAAVVN